jgi:hypothetical protein
MVCLPEFDAEIFDQFHPRRRAIQRGGIDALGWQGIG